jgi:hypothetical protein
MTLVELFAIRHKATGKFMPQRLFKKNGAGFTYWEPHDNTPNGYGGVTTVPRLFNNRQGVRQAINAWERGHASKLTFQERESWEMPEEYTVEAGVTYDSKLLPHPRKPGDLEIVTFTLKEKTL